MTLIRDERTLLIQRMKRGLLRPPGVLMGMAPIVIHTGRAKALRYIALRYLAFKVTGWGSDRTGDSPKPHRDCRGTPVPRKDRWEKALAKTGGEGSQ